MGWTVYLVSNFTSLFRWETACGHEMAECWGLVGEGVEGLPAGLTLINWGLVRFVEISVLKWASVSSSSSPGALRGYLVVIPSNFLGFFRTLPFIPKEFTWRGSVFCRLLWQKWHWGRWCDRSAPETTSSHAPSWFNVPQLHQKVCQPNRAQCGICRDKNLSWNTFQREMKGMNNKD